MFSIGGSARVQLPKWVGAGGRSSGIVAIADADRADGFAADQSGPGDVTGAHAQSCGFPGCLTATPTRLSHGALHFLGLRVFAALETHGSSPARTTSSERHSPDGDNQCVPGT
ncbi:MAG: hypothetical protein QOH07_2248 [Mycobacterium sp.]|jgi:hypothetical protein|nr:hypothetical protein [Mycobacterium sp.]